MKIIEITRGSRPKGEAFLFGHTVESDFYVAMDCPCSWWEEAFIEELIRVKKMKNFKYSLEHKKWIERVKLK